MHNIYAGDIKRKEYTNVSMVELYTYCSMNNQYVEGVQNRKRLTCIQGPIWRSC